MRSCKLDVSGLVIKVVVCEYRKQNVIAFRHVGFEVHIALTVKSPGFLLLRTEPDFSEEI
jgi:hypothetical protein